MKQGMHIIYVHRTQGVGVEAVHINGIAKSFEELGHRVTLISPSGINALSPSELKKPSSKGSKKNELLSLVSRHMPEMLFELAEIAYNFLCIRRLFKVGTSSADLIYERYAIFSIAGVLFSKVYKTPILLEVNYTAKTPLVRRRSRLLQPLAVLFDRWIFNNATGLIVVSSFLKSHVINEYGISEDRITVLPNAADPAAFSDQVVPIAIVQNQEIGSQVIGFVGGFYPWHGLDILVDAFIQVSGDYPAAKMLLVGDGQERESIERKVISANLRERVIFAGKVPHAQLANYIAGFTVGVMPDSNEYGSPMKIFEYMAMGKPVVVPDYAPLHEVITHGKQGLIFPRGDVQGLAAALRHVLSNPDKLRQMGREARQYIVEEQNWLNNARKSLLLMSAKSCTQS